MNGNGVAHHDSPVLFYREDHLLFRFHGVFLILENHELASWLLSGNDVENRMESRFF